MLEGVMMRGVRTWAVAVRKPRRPSSSAGRMVSNGGIEVRSFPLASVLGRHRILALQRLTTREPDLDQLGVAIAALDAVLREEAGDARGAGALIGLEVGA